MKKALQVTLGTLLAASVVAPAFAHYAHYDHFLNQSAVWVVGTYTKPSNNGLSVGDLILGPSAVGGGFDGGHRAIFLEPGYDWDYGLGARFHFAHSHSHVFVTYDHYRDHEDREDINLQNIGGTPPGSSAEASVRERSNEFRLGLGHGLHFGRHFCVDLAAFFEYDRLSRSLHEENESGGNDNVRDTFNRVRGYGPGIGATGRVYPFQQAPHWSFFASIMNTLLYATEDFEQTYAQNNLLGYFYDPEQSKSVIGKIDINFGVEFCSGLAFSHHRGAPRLDIALGMRFLNMFNAFKNGNTAFNPLIQGAPGGIAVVNGFAANTGYPQDWGRWGPYVQFSILGPNA